jgi:threonine/homoserine/homoserine lactone efflux protein
VVTPSLETTGLFALAALAVLLLPGPAVLYITALGLREGRTPALGAAVGLGIGNFMHVIAAAVGLSALLVSSALAFSVVKYIGAAYLIYLGIQTLRNRHAASEVVANVSRTTTLREFRRGIVVNTLNPKVAIFFLAFVPQFIDPERGSVALQVLMLGTLFALLGIVTDALYGITAGEFGIWLRGRKLVQQRIQTATGIVYILLGLLAAFSNLDRNEAAGTAGGADAADAR